MKYMTALFVVLMLLLSVTPTLANNIDTASYNSGDKTYSYLNSDTNGFYITLVTGSSYLISGPGYTLQHL
jgi:hypothetical protein